MCSVYRWVLQTSLDDSFVTGSWRSSRKLQPSIYVCFVSVFLLPLTFIEQLRSCTTEMLCFMLLLYSCVCRCSDMPNGMEKEIWHQWGGSSWHVKILWTPLLSFEYLIYILLFWIVVWLFPSWRKYNLKYPTMS